MLIFSLQSLNSLMFHITFIQSFIELFYLIINDLLHLFCDLSRWRSWFTWRFNRLALFLHEILFHQIGLGRLIWLHCLSWEMLMVISMLFILLSFLNLLIFAFWIFKKLPFLLHHRLCLDWRLLFRILFWRMLFHTLLLEFLKFYNGTSSYISLLLFFLILSIIIRTICIFSLIIFISITEIL